MASCLDTKMEELTVRESGEETVSRPVEEHGNHEMETGFENDAELPERYKNCTKNPGHTKFISVKNFSLTDLPEEYKDDGLLDLVRHQVPLAVRIKIRGSSQHRPSAVPGTDNPYPFSGKRERKVIRAGSGWVSSAVLKEEELCICVTCQQTGQPVKLWGKIEITTAAHVVFDEIEGGKTICYFFYDDDSTDLEKCPYVRDPIAVRANVKTDFCRMTFVIHDTDLVKQLAEVDRNYMRLFCKVRDKFKKDVVDENKEDIGDRMRRLSDRYKETANKFERIRDRLKLVLSGDVEKQWEDYKSKQRQEGKKTLNRLGYILWDMVNGGDVGTVDVTFMTGQSEDCNLTLGQLEILLHEYQNQTLSERDRETIVDIWRMYRQKAEEMDGHIRYFQHILDDPFDQNFQASEQADLYYNPQRALAIMVAHPHGCSKKITIGEIAERQSVGHRTGVACRYVCTNDTCPGCSGARVFVLGKTKTLSDHPHSSTSDLGDDDQQANESAVTLDF